MIARFQRDVQRAEGRINALFTGVAQAVHLGVSLAEHLVPALGHNVAVAHQYRAHRGIGGRAPASLFGQLKRRAHELFVLIHDMPPSFSSLMASSFST